MVAIRLTRAGTKHRPFYRIVAIDREKPRESRFIDLIGHYNPISDPAEIKLDVEKYNEWIKKGAKPSQTVRSLLKKVLRSEN
ncbi:MAG: 30S ribosomal protein S16 [Acidobacteriota bacterium]|jgi:small subunit ribosomal protein S16|nr:30S ribosomal protein S16 [Acidobacteriota bacterium]